MKKVLILYPHFPPSNLAGVHRPRLFAQHLKEFGWEPVVLTVDEIYYEELPDYNLVKLLPPDLRIEKSTAFSITNPRLVGDIGLRAFFQLFKKAKHLISNEKFDFLYISVPSFYTALIGRRLHNHTGIPYGIDYIDPWVHHFPGSEKVLSRHWFSTKLSGILEPVAVKKASLITGVAAGYYEPVLERNPHLRSQAVIGAMPYGGEEKDHALLKSLQLKPYLFEKKLNKIQLVYAGAMLPKAYAILEAICISIRQHREMFDNIEFHFIGTGKTPDDVAGFNIKPVAEKYGLWQTLIFEHPKRIPYLDVLVHLQQADGIFIMGSTESHYTPSKSYQAILSEKPVLAVLHQSSTAVEVLQRSGAAQVTSFNGEAGLEALADHFNEAVGAFKKFLSVFDPTQVNKELFAQYSARSITQQLAAMLDEVWERQQLLKAKKPA